MKPEASIEDKKQALANECDDEEKDDEKPVVVVLDEGDLTADEVNSHKEVSSDEKIVFKRPTKRNRNSGLNASTKKPKHDEDCSLKKPKSSKDKKTATQATSPSLLSFDHDDDD